MKKLVLWVCLIGTLAFILGQSSMISDWIEQKYVNEDPQSEEAPKVLYQIGKYCYFLSNNERALKSWNRVLTEYEETHWAAASLFMIGKTHEKRGEVLQARLAFRRMGKDYPFEEEWVAKANAKLEEYERNY